MSDEPGDEIEQWIADCLTKSPEANWTSALQRLCEEHPGASELRARVSAITRALQLRGDARSSGDPAEDAAGALFGGYRIVRLLGSGGMGVVHVAEQLATKRTVALKRLRPEFVGSERLRQRFRREVELAASLDHPNIGTIYEAGEVDGVPFLAMQLVEGRPLDRVIAERGAIGPRDLGGVLGLLARIGNALHHAHRRGLVHRDVKPSNVLCRADDGEPLVLDFGLARPLDTDADEALTMSGEVVGTPAYLAPEQIDGSPRHTHDHLIDVYALGVTAYECLTGSLPFEAPTRAALYRKILDGSPPRVTSRLPFAPRDLDVVVETAMAVEPARRYATAALLAEDLLCVRDGRPIAARRIPAIARAARWARRYPLVASLLALLLVVSFVATGYAWLASVRLEERRHASLLAAARGAPSRELKFTLARIAAEESPGFEELSLLHSLLQGAQWRAQLAPPAPSGHVPVIVDGHGTVWAASREPAAYCWRADRGAVPLALPRPAGWLALSPDGGTVALACREHGVLLVPAGPPGSAAAQEWRRIEGLDDARVAEFTSDGRLVVGGGDGAVWIDGRDGLRRTPTPAGWEVGEIICAARHPVTGDVLMGTDSPRGGAIVRLATDGSLQVVGRFPRQVWQIQCAASSPRFLALHTGCSVWSLAPANGEGGPVKLLQIAHLQAVTGAAFYGDEILTGHADAGVRVWQVPPSPASEPQPAELWRGHIGWVTRVACDTASRRVVSVDARGLVLVWDRDTGRALTSFEATERWPTAVGFLGGDSVYVRFEEASMLGVVELPAHAAASAHRLRGVPLQLATADETIVVATNLGWLQRLADTPPRRSEVQIDAVPNALALRRGGDLVCAFLKANGRGLWEFAYFDAGLVPAGTASFPIGSGQFVPRVAWRSDGSALAALNVRQAGGILGRPAWVATRRSGDGAWESAPTAPGLPEAATVTALAFLDDRRIAVGFADRVATYCLAEAAEGARWTEELTLPVTGHTVSELQPAVDRVFIGTTMGQVLVWRPEAGELVQIHGLRHDARPIPSPDGRHLLAAGGRNVVVATIDGERLYQVERTGNEKITVCGFLGAGRLVVAGGTQQTLEAWPLEPEATLTRARRLEATLPTYDEVAPYLDLLPAAERAGLERLLRAQAPADGR